MKRIISVLLVIAILSGTAISASAATEDTASPMFTNIKRTATSLDITSQGGPANCRAYCQVTTGYTVRIECTLQIYRSSQWSPVKSWTGSGTTTYTISESWPVSSGCTYRVYAKYYAYNTAGTLVESTSVVSQSSTCP